jgi:hypothetical protein
VPDIWEVAAQVQPAFDEIRDLAAAKDPTIVEPAAPITPTASAAKKKPAPRKRAAAAKKAAAAPSTAHVVDITEAITSTPTSTRANGSDPA